MTEIPRRTDKYVLWLLGHWINGIYLEFWVWLLGFGFSENDIPVVGNGGLTSVVGIGHNGYA